MQSSNKKSKSRNIIFHLKAAVLIYFGSVYGIDSHFNHLEQESNVKVKSAIEKIISKEELADKSQLKFENLCNKEEGIYKALNYADILSYVFE